MREDWRPPPLPDGLDEAAIRAMVAIALPGAAMTGFARISGGFSNLGFRVALAGRAAVHLRLWSAGSALARFEVALLRHLGAQGCVPVPQVVAAPEVPDPATGRPFAVLEWVEGQSLAEALATAPATPPAGAAFGRAAGAVLAAIHARTFSDCGFLSADLTLSHRWPCGAAGYLAALERILSGTAGQRLAAHEARTLMRFATALAPRLESEPRPPCLVHGDFGASNILVAGPSGAVAAVIDWEFAFAADPLIDIANIMRSPAGERPGFAAGLVAGYRAGGGVLPTDWRRLALITDLPAWVAHLGHAHPGQNDPARTRDARARIASTLAAFGYQL